MAPKERRAKRYWSHFEQGDIQRMANATPREEYMFGEWGQGPYMAAFDTSLIGKRFEVECEDGFKIAFEQTAQREVKWELDGVEHTDPVSVHTITPNVYFFNHYCEGSVPPEAHQYVLDLDNGLVTVFVAKMCQDPAAPREVSRDIHFGFIANGSYADPGYRHDFTCDMVGKAIVWNYNPEKHFPKHIYVSNNYYTVSGTFSADWAASNPADYIKIRDGVYIFSFLEDRQSGAQGFFLMDLYQMHDVGCFFGMEPEGLVCYTIGAVGTWAPPYTLPGGIERPEVFGWEK